MSSLTRRATKGVDGSGYSVTDYLITQIWRGTPSAYPALALPDLLNELSGMRQCGDVQRCDVA